MCLSHRYHCTLSLKKSTGKSRKSADKKAFVWYHRGMKNWCVDTTELQKNPEQFKIWRLEQLINFGLDDETIDLKQLRAYWDVLRIDPAKREFLSLFL